MTIEVKKGSETIIKQFFVCELKEALDEVCKMLEGEQIEELEIIVKQ